jgi:hypothetical protein
MEIKNIVVFWPAWAKNSQDSQPMVGQWQVPAMWGSTNRRTEVQACPENKARSYLKNNQCKKG